MGVVYGLFLKWCKRQQGNFLIGDTSHWQTICPTWLDFWALYFQRLILKQFPGNARYFQTFKPAGCTGQNSGSLIERIVHYRRSHLLTSRMTAGSSIYKEDRDLTPKYVNHSVAVLDKYLAAAC